MAYNTKYRAEYYDFHSGTKHRVDILKKDHPEDSVETIEVADDSPVSYKAMNEGKGKLKIVRGAEVVFRFVAKRGEGCDRVENIDTYNDLFESEYKDWLLEWSKEVEETYQTLFKGWVKVEDIYHSLTDYVIEIDITATDALAYLKNKEFTDVLNNPYEEKQSILSIVKKALSKTGIELDFEIKLNTKEENIESEGYANTLVGAEINPERFVRERDGRDEVDNCFDVLEKVLKDFGVTLIQWNNRYCLHNDCEGDSTKQVFNWDDLQLNNEAKTEHDTIDVTNMKVVRGGDDVTYVSPIAILDVTHLNRNKKEDLVEGLNIFEAADRAWDDDYYPAFHRWNEINGAMEWLLGPAHEEYDGDDVDAALHYFILKDNFRVERITLDDHLILQFRYEITDHNTTLGDKVGVKISFLDSGGVQIGDAKEISLHAGGNGTLLRHEVELPSTGYYNLKIEWSHIDQDIYFEDGEYVDVKFSNFALVRAMKTEDGEYIKDISFDKHHRYYRSDVEGRKEEMELHFADTKTFGDLGRFEWFDGLQYHGTEEDKWKLHGDTEYTRSIIDTFSQYILRLNQKYTRHNKLTFVDKENELKPVSIIQIDGGMFLIESFEKESKYNRVTVRVREYIDDEVSYTKTVDDMTSIDGESTGTAGTKTTEVDPSIEPHTHGFGDIPISEADRNNWNEAYESYVAEKDIYRLHQPDGTNPFVYTDNNAVLYVGGKVNINEAGTDEALNVGGNIVATDDIIAYSDG